MTPILHCQGQFGTTLVFGFTNLCVAEGGGRELVILGVVTVVVGAVKG